jgi:hypothetical protein
MIKPPPQSTISNSHDFLVIWKLINLSIDRVFAKGWQNEATSTSLHSSEEVSKNIRLIEQNLCNVRNCQYLSSELSGMIFHKWPDISRYWWIVMMLRIGTTSMISWQFHDGLKMSNHQYRSMLWMIQFKSESCSSSLTTQIRFQIPSNFYNLICTTYHLWFARFFLNWVNPSWPFEQLDMAGQW